jgi:TonB family protein
MHHFDFSQFPHIICPQMQNNTSKFLVLEFLVFAMSVTGVCCAGKEDPVSPVSLLAQARKLQELWTDGTPPITMRTEIQILDSKGKITLGQYVVTWLSSSKWREELQVADYKRLRVHDANGYWQQSTLSFQPEIIFQLDSLLNFRIFQIVGAKQIFGKVKNLDKDGVRQNCTEVKSKMGIERVLCFDETSGNLLNVEYPAKENQNPPDISRIEYSAFNKVGDKRIPFEVRALRGRTVLLKAKVLDVTPIAEENPALFLTPKNAEFWPQCHDMQNPELVARVQPIYPPSARTNREQGRVMLYAVIESSGALSHLTIINRTSPSLELAAAEAVRQWHYKPAACGLAPIRVETSIDVDFWLKY